ncbi:MAG: hypothetical protein GY832_30140 [Chloroflexi bacterium]|nr:hypothetical protein [Chloroflexota bacterium]
MNGKYICGFLLLLVLAVLLSVSGVVLAANGFEINRWVVGGGGGPAEGGDYVLNATVGQAVVGNVTGSPYELCAGFWCGMGAYKVYLPLVVRNG